MEDTLKFFDVICKISNALGTSSKYEDLLKLVVEGAVEAMNGKGAALFLTDENDEFFVSVCNTGLSENYQHSNPLRTKEIIDYMVKEGGFLASNDIQNDSRIPNHEAKKAEGIASLLAVPVVVKDNVIGALTLYTAEIRDYSEKEIRLLQALAEHGGIAIENAKLIDGLVSFTQLFKKISEDINSSLDIKKILHALTVDICESLELKGALIRLRDQTSGELKLVADHGLSKEFLDKGPVYTDKGFAKVLAGENLMVHDVANSEIIQYPKETEKEGIVSILSVPIKTKETIIGVLNLYSDKKTKFTGNNMIPLAEALAIQGGIAIQNASLYLQLHESKESLVEDLWGFRSFF
jgi:GAF domain-containing protein